MPLATVDDTALGHFPPSEWKLQVAQCASEKIQWPAHFKLLYVFWISSRRDVSSRQCYIIN